MATSRAAVAICAGYPRKLPTKSPRTRPEATIVGKLRQGRNIREKNAEAPKNASSRLRNFLGVRPIRCVGEAMLRKYILTGGVMATVAAIVLVVALPRAGSTAILFGDIVVARILTAVCASLASARIV